ncbi:hypothetical protein QNE22_002458 [Vibrio fluvialis]|nr:hypothetical protein [Vibrio fluvialis]
MNNSFNVTLSRILLLKCSMAIILYFNPIDDADLMASDMLFKNAIFSTGLIQHIDKNGYKNGLGCD